MNPTLRAAFCSICSAYGHFIDECANYTAVSHRRPEFVEQLIPYHLKKFYGINTKTPIEAVKKTEYLQIVNTTAAIKAALEERGLPVLANSIENKKRLERWGIENGKMIMYMTKEKGQKKKD